MISLLIFEVGSLICAVAPSSTAFILGRAIAGLGGAGVLCGSLVIAAHTVPLKTRPNVTGLIGAMFGVASVSGPLVGIDDTQNHRRQINSVIAGWSFDRQGLVAMVLLHQPSYRVSRHLFHSSPCY